MTSLIFLVFRSAQIRVSGPRLCDGQIQRFLWWLLKIGSLFSRRAVFIIALSSWKRSLWLSWCRICLQTMVWSSNRLLCPLSVSFHRPVFPRLYFIAIQEDVFDCGENKTGRNQRVWDQARGSCLMWSVPEGLWHMEDITYPASPERNHQACKHGATTAPTNFAPLLMSGPDCVFYGFS